MSDLEALVEPTTRGDPDSPLRWTCKSVRRLAEALHAQGHQASRTLVGELLTRRGIVCKATARPRRATATGITLSTIGRGLKELGEEEAPGRVRRPGGGTQTGDSQGPDADVGP
jgi:hypothetical protein